MATLFCVRHGETDWNRERRWQGQDDQPLNALGHEQSAVAARALATDRFAAIYTSDLRRARETAHPLAMVLELRPVVEQTLREVDTGSWTGLTHGEVSERHPEAMAAYSAGRDGWHDGESFSALFDRSLAAASAIAARHARNERVVVFTHGGVIRSLVAAALGAGWEESRRHVAPAIHCGLTVIEIPQPPAAWRLHMVS